MIVILSNVLYCTLYNYHLHRFVATQFALGNEIMLALGQVTNRVAETKVRVVISEEKVIAGATEK